MTRFYQEEEKIILYFRDHNLRHKLHALAGDFHSLGSTTFYCLRNTHVHAQPTISPTFWSWLKRQSSEQRAFNNFPKTIQVLNCWLSCAAVQKSSSRWHNYYAPALSWRQCDDCELSGSGWDKKRPVSGELDSLLCWQVFFPRPYQFFLFLVVRGYQPLPCVSVWGRCWNSSIATSVCAFPRLKEAADIYRGPCMMWLRFKLRQAGKPVLAAYSKVSA